MTTDATRVANPASPIGEGDAPTGAPAHHHGPEAHAQTLALEPDGAVDHTLAAPITASDAVAGTTLRKTVQSARITVLPRVETESDHLKITPVERVRYETVRLLGAGGMGEVNLAKDHDIGRTVAIKSLLGEGDYSADSLARFVEEVRTIGRLEHPNIIPLHDVGVNDKGEYYFVMKYVDGETLETVIEKLDQGDPEYHAKYTPEYRIEVFLGVLRALQYAHANGIVHRDLKPANVIVGRYGEVVLMDWGIAKPIRSASDFANTPTAAEASAGADDAPASDRSRLFTTRHGALIGTPAYMSPEQARGANDQVDERSDLYSAVAMFHELLSLRHYLSDKRGLAEMLTAVITEDRPFVSFAFNRHPKQPSPPAELLHIVAKGLKKKPAERFQSANELIEALQDVQAGKIRVQCYVTMTKRMARESSRFVDRYPNVAFVSMVGGASLVVWALVRAVITAVA